MEVTTQGNLRLEILKLPNKENKDLATYKCSLYRTKWLGLSKTLLKEVEFTRPRVMNITNFSYSSMLDQLLINFDYGAPFIS